MNDFILQHLWWIPWGIGWWYMGKALGEATACLRKGLEFVNPKLKELKPKQAVTMTIKRTGQQVSFYIGMSKFAFIRNTYLLGKELDREDRNRDQRPAG